MSPKSGNRFWDKDVHRNKILERIPKSVKRFSEKVRVDDGLCANEQC